MAHYTVLQNDDDTISAIYKDGNPVEGGYRLEMPTAIVQTYFKSAVRNLRAMRPEIERDDARFFGLQAFLMSLVGLEAFTNIFFHLVGRERSDETILRLANSTKPVEHKLSGLVRRAFGSTLQDQKMLLRKVRELYDLRSAIVHPKWQPSSIQFSSGIAIAGLVENYQAMFEDRVIVLEALQWCLLIVSRVGVLNCSGNSDWFGGYWTGVHDTHDQLVAALALSGTEQA